MTGKKYYCVWSEQETILCLTTDYGIALDVYGNHMIDSGYVTDDSWADAIARIEEFDEWPVTRRDIMDALSDDEYIAWNAGDTVML
jgi:DNA phosphorothioation-dependent restriction protein DptG